MTFIKFSLFLSMAVACFASGILIPESERGMHGKDRISAHTESGKKIPVGGKILITGWYCMTDSVKGVKRKLGKSDESFYIDPEPIVTVKHFEEFEIAESKSGGRKSYCLNILLNATGRERWRVATGYFTGKKLGFILDDQLIYTPLVTAQIESGMSSLNLPDETKEGLERIQSVLEKEMESH